MANCSNQTALYIGKVLEPRGRDPETRYDQCHQWYATSPGQERLRNMYEGVQDIASDGNAEMKRDAMTHDMTFVFKSRGIEWEIAFPKDFPAVFLKLKELTWLGDRRPIVITKRNTPLILAEIENIVKRHDSNTDDRPPPPTKETRTTTTGHVARMGKYFETGGRDAETRYDQWYAISPGQERLKNMYEGVQDIASDGNVEMKRDNMTHDMTFIFKSRGIEWEIAFPKDFPAGFLKLKELTWLGDKRPVTITKRNIPLILAEIDNTVKRHESNTDDRPPLPLTSEARTITTGHVARMGRVFETGGRDAETRYDQWYAISPGQERLKNMYEGVKDIASDGNVEMKRNNMTHDMSFVFKSRGIEWEIAFPKDFPAGFLKLKELTWLEDRRPIMITKRNTRNILAEIENFVKKPRGSLW